MATIKEIQQRLELVTELSDSFLEEVAKDQRSGVQKAVEKRKKVIQAELDEDLRLDQMLRYEKELYQAGYQAIAGIDEVGRGPLAGPVVAAAVILPPECKIKGLNDSKKIPKKKHQEIYQAVMDRALAVGVGLIDNDIIDQVNIYQASRLAMQQAVSELKIQPDYLLIDAMKIDVNTPQIGIIKGDAKSISIAAASIVAKQVRDQMMQEFDELYPGYDFSNNAGYGTPKHLEGLKSKGICPIHRKTFAPIKDYLE